MMTNMHGMAMVVPAGSTMAAWPTSYPGWTHQKPSPEGIPDADQLAAMQEAAVREERKRLARELHDSLSQTLYALALGAQATQTLLDRDVDQARQANGYVRSLAATALAEVRALIFALPPASLTRDGLIESLRRQAHDLSALHAIPVHLQLCGEPAASMQVKEALYRIAREALHNVLKHAQATRVELRLEQYDSELLLEVRDDGIGFDAGCAFPGHLGLCSMEERATHLGGTFTLESTPGRGTCIRVRIPSATASGSGAGADGA